MSHKSTTIVKSKLDMYKIQKDTSFSRSQAKENNVYDKMNHTESVVLAALCPPVYAIATLLGETDAGQFLYDKPNDLCDEQYRNELHQLLVDKTEVLKFIEILVTARKELETKNQQRNATGQCL